MYMTDLIEILTRCIRIRVQVELSQNARISVGSLLQVYKECYKINGLFGP